MSIRPIDANALLKQIDLLPFGAMEFCELARVNHIVRIIQSQPTLDYAPVRHGEWIPVDEETPCDEWDCTACGERKTFVYRMDYDEMEELYRYCPNCGAKMEGGKENG